MYREVLYMTNFWFYSETFNQIPSSFCTSRCWTINMTLSQGWLLGRELKGFIHLGKKMYLASIEAIPMASSYPRPISEVWYEMSVLPTSLLLLPSTFSVLSLWQYFARKDCVSVSYIAVCILFMLMLLGWLGSQENLWRTACLRRQLWSQFLLINEVSDL